MDFLRGCARVSAIFTLLLASVGCQSARPTETAGDDTDGDGWTDAQEYVAGTDASSRDTDMDGYWDPLDPNPLDLTIPKDGQAGSTIPTPPQLTPISAPGLLGKVTLPLKEGVHAGWDLGEVVAIEAWLWSENRNISFQNGTTWVLGDRDGNQFIFQTEDDLLNSTRGEWRLVRIPLEGNDRWRVTQVGKPSLRRVDYVEIHADTWGTGFTLWIDGLSFVKSGSDPDTLVVRDLTESNAAGWGVHNEDARPIAVSDDRERLKMGSSSLRLQTEGGFDNYIRFPKDGGPLELTLRPSPPVARIGEAVTWSAYPTGGSGEYVVAWSGTDSISGSSLELKHSYARQGWASARVNMTSQNGSVTKETGIWVLHREPMEAPTVNPVLWVPAGVEASGWVPQLERTLREVRAQYQKVFGKTFVMNPLVVVRSKMSLADIGDTDKVMDTAMKDAQQAVGTVVPFAREILVMAWGAGGWAGGWGWDIPMAGVGEWAIGGAVGMPQPGGNDFRGGISTIGHELGHNIAYDDPHNNDFFDPSSIGEYDHEVSLLGPWLRTVLEDQSSPTIRMTSPGYIAVSGTVPIKVEASDETAMDAVLMVVDGQLHDLDRDAPYEFSWDTSQLSSGRHEVILKAYDASGNTSEVSHSFDVAR